MMVGKKIATCCDKNDMRSVVGEMVKWWNLLFRCILLSNSRNTRSISICSFSQTITQIGMCIWSPRIPLFFIFSSSLTISSPCNAHLHASHIPHHTSFTKANPQNTLQISFISIYSQTQTNHIFRRNIAIKINNHQHLFTRKTPSHHYPDLLHHTSRRFNLLLSPYQPNTPTHTTLCLSTSTTPIPTCSAKPPWTHNKLSPSG